MAKVRSKLLNEAVKRSGTIKPSFSANDYCFDKQLGFIKSPNRFKTAVCSRRAGKTIGIAADLIDTCLNEKDVTCLYVTLTSRNARNIIWPDIKRILEDYKIPAKTDDTRLEVTFEGTRSQLKLGGAKDETEIEKYRGWKLKKAYIDECQSFRPYIKYFIDDILIPALRDLRGSLALTGTPGPVPAGPFFEYANAQHWEHHHWTAFDNPHMKDLDAVLAEERKIKGITEDDPGYIRETFGKWIEDYNSLVFKFSPEKNLYKVKPEKLAYVFGIDIGYIDADAIAVLGYNLETKHVYLVDEVVREKQNITDLVEEINRLKAIYNPIKMVMDAGALGKKIQSEIETRHQLSIAAAEKTRKLEFIELLNDDLRTGKFKTKEGSRFQEDCFLVQWDRSDPTKPVISDIYHSDICDAVLYAWRECRHFLATTQPIKPKRGTPEYYEYEAKLMEEADEEAFAKAKDRAFWNEDIDPNKTEFWEK